MPLYKICFLATILALVFSSCYSPETPDSIEITNLDAQYAIPLINTTARILDIEESTGDNTGIYIDDEGRMTIFYNGNVLRRTTLETYPPVPGSLIGDIPFDSSYSILYFDEVVPFEGGFTLRKAIFKGSSIQFKMKSSVQEAIHVTINLDQVEKDGQVFSQEIDLYTNGGYGETVITPLYSLNGYQITTDDNSLRISYTATTESGDVIELDEASFYFDFLNFEYIEGFFTQDNNSESGDVITVGVYTTWISGGLDFEDPKVTIKVENSFGFPVKATFKYMELTNILDEKFYITGTAIEDGFDIPFPPLDDVGGSRSDEFILDKTNSNIQEIFNEKVKLVRYDVTATNNPDNDMTMFGFLTDSSFYNVDIDIELPLQLSINNLVLGDTFDIDLSGYDDVANAEFKLLTENSFPFNMLLQAYMLDNSDNVIDSMFLDAGYQIDAGVSSLGQVLETTKNEVKRDMDDVSFDKIKSAKKIFIKTKFTNGNAINGPQWIYDDYQLGIKMGAIINIKK